MTQELMSLLGVPIFNHVEQVYLEVKDASKVTVKKADLMKLPGLERFTVRQKISDLSETAAQAIQDKVSPCRISSLEKTKSEVKIELNTNSLFSCKCP